MIDSLPIFICSTIAAATPATPTPTGTQVQSIWEFVVKGGPMMIPIGLCSIIALTITVERITSLRQRRIIPPAFLPGLNKILSENASSNQKALEYCDKTPSPLSNVFAAGVRRLGDPIDYLERHIQEAGEREAITLRHRLRALAVIASVTPLLGLLGTMLGMIQAFQTVSISGEALGKTELLAGGIYEAMITTAAGLTVAIPALIAHHWVAARVDRLIADIDRMTVGFIETHASSPGTSTILRSRGTSFTQDVINGTNTPTATQVEGDAA